MKLAALRLFNVKRFADRGVAIEGIGDGVNVLCAANEFGKSTSFEALHGLFFQPHSSTAGDVRSLRPYSGGSPLIEADIAVGDHRYRITKQFYSGRFAKVTDLATGRLIAQADEAENFIAGLINGGAGGPAGLLWVRQGITGLERRSRSEEDNDKQVRASLLESVQGEVEAVTGGRRMAEIMAAVADEAAALVTPTGRPKSGGRYAAAIDLCEQLGQDEQRLANEVALLREALDRRVAAQRRLAELDVADERAARRKAVIEAEAAFDAARSQHDRLKTAEAELNLARERHGAAERDHRQFQEALAEAKVVQEEWREAMRRRDEAASRRRDAIAGIESAQRLADAAESDERAARELLDRLNAAARARAAAERHAELAERLSKAEKVRGALEKAEAQLAQTRLPAGAVDELADLDVEIARIHAALDAARPSVTVDYDTPNAPPVTMDGAALHNGDERGYDGNAELLVPRVGRITLRSNKPGEDDGRLDRAENKRRALLDSMGVADLAAARAQQVSAKATETQIVEARAQLAVLAPDGLARLREEVAGAQNGLDCDATELNADPAETRAAAEAAEEQRKQAGHTIRALEATRASAEDAFVAAETALAKLQTREQQITATLGPADARDQRGQTLADRLATLRTGLADAQVGVDDLRTAARDLEAAEATLRRVRSIEQGAETEIQQLRETLAGLNAQISTRSDEAVEEKWREITEALSAAQTRVAAFEREVAVLDRLTEALENARSNARDQYLRPVMDELRPLLGLLFDDISISFDERTLLPQTILRGGQEEDVERLSGGMREQLSVLTRLAFARLLARDGHPAPVILDDALVYSDDDRIERMFDALHRQAREQQIIVFSCRQRAFQRLGGNVLQMTEWRR
jgi:DNA repair exonuclease SbcCD ATPase subunit